MSTLLAATLAAAAAAMALPVRGLRGARDRVWQAPGPLVVAGGVLVLVTMLLVLMSGRRLVLALIAVGTTFAVVRMVARARGRARAERRRDQVLAMCTGMRAALSAGEPPLRALSRAAQEWPDLEPVHTAARLGADVPDALRGVAGSPGCEGLHVVAAAWQVAHESGAGLAPAMTVAVERVVDRRTTSRLLRAELSSAHATARTMAALPVLVLLLGGGIGADPVHFLLDNPFGLGCLATGVALSMLGAWWLERIAEGVLR